MSMQPLTSGIAYGKLPIEYHSLSSARLLIEGISAREQQAGCDAVWALLRDLSGFGGAFGRRVGLLAGNNADPNESIGCQSHIKRRCLT